MAARADPRLFGFVYAGCTRVSWAPGPRSTYQSPTSLPFTRSQSLQPCPSVQLLMALLLRVRADAGAGAAGAATTCYLAQLPFLCLYVSIQQCNSAAGQKFGPAGVIELASSPYFPFVSSVPARQVALHAIVALIFVPLLSLLHTTKMSAQSGAGW
jgi:hypothetical protein